jgi:hypothetical protein
VLILAAPTFFYGSFFVYLFAIFAANDFIGRQTRKDIPSKPSTTTMLAKSTISHNPSALATLKTRSAI